MPATDYSKKRATVETNKGSFTIKFRADKAPLHVENFVKLAEGGKYNGSPFHRVIPGFMIQGGDFTKKDGTGGHSWNGPGTTIKAEFNDIQHDKGTVSMARTSDPNSAGSQFFVCVGRQTFLDNKYTAFGQVESGYEVVDAISKMKCDGRDKPVEDVIIQSVKLFDAQ